MSPNASITVLGPREEIERRWHSTQESQWTPTFREAPGDRGTEIHIEAGRTAMAKAKAELRRFKQLCETGEVPRSDASPEGDRPERLLKQRPAQPVERREAVPA